MRSKTLGSSKLSSNDISYIVNLICPRCGGPLGAPAQEFKCQGRCRKDWRAEWENGAVVSAPKRGPRVNHLTSKRSPHASPRRHPWRGILLVRS